MQGDDYHRNVLRDLYNILGPEVPKCMECEGCRFEWQEALNIIKGELGITEEKPQ
jgi:hypothetical protein